MNADNAEVLRSGGSSGVAGISTFMSRTRTPLSNSTLRIGTTWSPGRTCTCSGSRDGSISLCRQVFGSAGQVRRPLRVLLRIQIIQDQRDEFAAALRNGTSEATN